MKKARSKRRVNMGAPIWDRVEPGGRAALAPLSRDAIVRAAIHLADTKGLAAVSLRKVGAVLEAGPMRLYGYLSTKEDLLELMVDEIYGEMASAGPIRGNWRRALRSIAKRTREAAHEHRWFIDLLGGRVHRGPNALAHLEASLAALRHTSGFESIDAVVQAVGTINAYVIGALRSEASDIRAVFEGAGDKVEGETTPGPYLQRMIATGRFPTLAQVARDASQPSADALFDRGLDCVLDGIAVRVLG